MRMLVMTVLLFCVTLLNAHSGSGQVLLLENFDYPAGNALNSHGWSIVQGGADISTVAPSGLSYTGYGGSGLGNAALLAPNTGSGHEDLGRSFTSQTSGDVYVSFLLNASAVDGSASFNFPLYVSASAGTGGWGRVYIDIDGNSNVRFGLSQFTESTSYTTFSFALNTTYLLVLKYTINDGAQNDQASLFVFTDPTLPTTEPTTPTLGPVSSGATDPSDIARIIIRRAGSSTNNITVDGIGVNKSWGDAPLPVELSSFTGQADGPEVALQWTTVSETNNFGFEVQRKQDRDDWQKIAFVAGKGTTVQTHHYLYVDHGVSPGAYSYRLKQIDTGGDFEYSVSLEVTVSQPSATRLMQNYPNPFNPATEIHYSLALPGKVRIKIFDLSGQTVRALVDQNQHQGEYRTRWDGRSDSGARLSSGIYFYTLQVDSRVVRTRRMLLVK